MGGIASLIYGTLYHTAIVYEEIEVEEKIPIPTPFGPSGTFGQEPMDDEQNPFDSGSSGPSPFGVSPDGRAGGIVESVNPFESPSVRNGTLPFEARTPSQEVSPRETVNPFENPFAGGRDPFQPGTAEDPLLSEAEPLGGELPRDGLPSGGLPPLVPPEPLFQTITVVDLVPRDEPEWVIVKEVTYGGVTRLENGQLKRTYSGQPPALCPT
jgi:hypothetical protein